MTKCIQCGNEINTGGMKGLLWCNMICKKEFFLDKYSGQPVKLWLAEKDKELMKTRKKILKEIKKSGLTVTEYIHELNK